MIYYLFEEDKIFEHYENLWNISNDKGCYIIVANFDKVMNLYDSDDYYNINSDDYDYSLVISNFKDFKDIKELIKEDINIIIVWN